MAVLDQVIQLKKQGYAEADIARYLKQLGTPEKEINEAFAQSKIKEEVTGESAPPAPEPAPAPSATREIEEPAAPTRGMTPSMLPSPAEEAAPESRVAPQAEAPAAPAEEYAAAPAEEYAGAEAGYGYQGGTLSIETITEIADQISSQKILKVSKKLKEVEDFKVLGEARLEALDKRLKKIEEVMDKIQIAIIGKLGEYGKNISDLKKETIGMQENFSKVISPIVEKSRAAQPTAQSKKPKKPAVE